MHIDLNDWFYHIKQLHDQRTELNLNRVKSVAKRLQLEHFDCPVITVAGTNGKGSVVKTLESIYFQAGFKVALYTSPHLMEFNERIRIHNQTISDTQLIRAFEIIDNARQETILSFFEFITLSALFLFQEAQCDVVILEVGLGGRLDTVNIVDSDVSVITSIGLDHTAMLGNTREEIAYEKACVARENKLLICGEENPPDTIAQTADAKKAVLFQINLDFFYSVSNYYFRCYGKQFDYTKLPIPHLKPQNCATAIAVIESLQHALPISSHHIAKGIAQTQWPGRFEMISSVIPCVLDVAHNESAAHWLLQQYRTLPPVQNTIGIVGMLKDKAMIETVSVLLLCVNTWYVCDLSRDTERGADGSVIAAFLQSKGQVCQTFASVSDAMYSLGLAHHSHDDDRALIFGSFYTVAAAKRWILEKEKKSWKKK